MNIANRKTIKINDILIFLVSEFHNDNYCEIDGHVQNINDEGVDVLYLSGYRSRTDFITWDKIIAKVCKGEKYKKLTHAPFSGHFLEFDSYTGEPEEDYNVCDRGWDEAFWDSDMGCG